MLLLTPGPANISEHVREAVAGPEIGHREAEFSELLEDTRRLLLEVCGVPTGYACALLGGSATTAVESVITSMPGSTSGLLVLCNGVYGERAAEIAAVFGVPHTPERFDWTAPLPLGRVEELVRTTRHDVIYLVHHETTTGVLNPLREVAGLARRYGKRVAVDGASSVGGEEIDLAGWGVDMLAGSANKCLRGVPGVSFVVVSEGMRQALEGRRRVAFSTDLLATLRSEERGETPFTPPVPALYGLREALRELREEGVGGRVEQYRAVAGALRDGLDSLGLRLLVRREHLSNTMTSVLLPRGVEYRDLHGPLKERGYVIYRSQGHLSETTFRLGTVGRIGLEEMRGFLDALEMELVRWGWHVESRPS